MTAPSTDPGFLAWRGQRLYNVMVSLTPCQEWTDDYAARLVDQIADEILNPTRPIAQPNWAALGLGSADEAAGRN